jgi:hypothetical protein
MILRLVEIEKSNEYLQAREYLSFHISNQNKIDSQLLISKIYL